MISYFIIILTKLGIFKWKRRIFIELFIFHDSVYIMRLYRIKFILLKTSLIFPEYCHLDIYVNDKFKYRLNKFKKLYNFLQRIKKMKLWVPKHVETDPRCWVHKDSLRIIRKIKLEQING